MAPLIPIIFIPFIALCHLSLSATAVVINNFSNDNPKVNNLGLPCNIDPKQGKVELVPECDGITMREYARWVEQLAEPNKCMDISDKALLIRNSVHYFGGTLEIEVHHKKYDEFKRCFVSLPLKLPSGIGECLLPFTADNIWDIPVCSYKLAQSIVLCNTREEVKIEHIELINFTGEDKERLLWTKSYMESSHRTSQSPQNHWIGNRAQIFEIAYREIMTMVDPRVQLKAFFEDPQERNERTTKFFSLLSQEIFNPDNGFFTFSEVTQLLYVNPIGDSTKFYKNLPGTMKLQGVGKPEVYRFIGRMMGQALIYKHVMDGDLSNAIVKAILNVEISLSDVASFDPDCHKQLQAIIDYDYSESGNTKPQPKLAMSSITGSAYDFDGSTVMTNENKHLIVQQAIRELYIDPVKEQINDIRQGILDVVPDPVRNEEGLVEDPIASGVVDFTRRISGRANFTAFEWEKWTYYGIHGAKRDDQMLWFWNTVANLNEQMFKKLFRIVFGFNRLPYVGFQGLLPQVFVLSKTWIPIRGPGSAVNVDELVPEVLVGSTQLRGIYLCKPSELVVAWGLDVPPYSSQEVLDTQIRAFIQNN